MVGSEILNQRRFLKRDFLHGDKFSVAIFFDACRYDLFKKHHRTYLKGELRKAWSPACHTYDWVRETLTGKYPKITVIGGHPLFNSKGVPVHGWTATKHFLPENIIDVWDFGYSDELGTINPDHVAKATIEHSDREKLLIWFLQPHCPYIGETKITRFYPHARGNLNKDLQHWVKTQLEGGTLSPEMLRHAYEDNLIAVLESMKSLSDVFDDPIIVTSDHAELLKEGGKFFHPWREAQNPVLREVPLFIGAIR